LRGDEAGSRALALDDGVGDQRRAVDGGGDRGGIELSFPEQGLQPLEHRHRGIARRRQYFPDDHLASVLVEQQQIGEGAADIDTGAIPSRIHTFVLKKAPGVTHEQTSGRVG